MRRRYIGAFLGQSVWFDLAMIDIGLKIFGIFEK
jgi:hypothetical protein